MKVHKFLIAFLFSCWLCPAQIINTIAGSGASGFSGDGGLATAASFSNPAGMAMDGSGNIYISDLYNNRIRKINTSGIISTIAGTGLGGYSGDGGPATAAQLYWPASLAIDASGNLFVADYLNSTIRKINTSGIITTVAGTGVAGFSGDGGPATSAQLNNCFGVALDASGNIYIGDVNNNRIRKVNTSGIISTIAGTGAPGFSGDGGAATSAQIYWPDGIKIDAAGNIYFADFNNNRVRKINTSGIITTVAGTGVAGFSGDGGLATSAKIDGPMDIAFDPLGNVYLMDGNNNRVRIINVSGFIYTVAGNGTAGYSGDGGIATSASLSYPWSISIYGNILYICDSFNQRLRQVLLVTDVKELSGAKHFSIYPNPNNGSFKINIVTPGEHEIILFDALQQKVCCQKLLPGENNIITENCSSGLYNYVILSDKETVDKGKLVIEH